MKHNTTKSPHVQVLMGGHRKHHYAGGISNGTPRFATGGHACHGGREHHYWGESVVKKIGNKARELHKRATDFYDFGRKKVGQYVPEHLIKAAEDAARNKFNDVKNQAHNKFNQKAGELHNKAADKYNQLKGKVEGYVPKEYINAAEDAARGKINQVKGQVKSDLNLRRGGSTHRGREHHFLGALVGNMLQSPRGREQLKNFGNQAGRFLSNEALPWAGHQAEEFLRTVRGHSHGGSARRSRHAAGGAGKVRKGMM